jgi:hypothetical protein
MSRYVWKATCPSPSSQDPASPVSTGPSTAYYAACLPTRSSPTLPKPWHAISISDTVLYQLSCREPLSAGESGVRLDTEREAGARASRTPRLLPHGLQGGTLRRQAREHQMLLRTPPSYRLITRLITRSLADGRRGASPSFSPAFSAAIPRSRSAFAVVERLALGGAGHEVTGPCLPLLELLDLVPPEHRDQVGVQVDLALAGS